MSKELIAERLKQTRIRRGYEYPKDAADAFGWNKNTYKSHENAQRGIPIETLEQYARAFRVRPEYLAFGAEQEVQMPDPQHVPVIGYIGAGEEWFPIDDHERGAGLDEISMELAHDVDPIAIWVRGDSMEPVYREGDALICSRWQGAEIRNLINEDVVVRTADGRGYLKILLKGSRPDKFRLRSYNPTYHDIEDVALEWAAPIAWIRRA